MHILCQQSCVEALGQWQSEADKGDDLLQVPAERTVRPLGLKPKKSPPAARGIRKFVLPGTHGNLVSQSHHGRCNLWLSPQEADPRGKAQCRQPLSERA